MKKVYTIEITGSHLSSIWYADKIGEQFEACLKLRNYSNNIVVFSVGSSKHVYPVDCKVVAERNVIVEVYTND